MSVPKKLMGRRQIATIVGAMLLGTALAGGRIYAERGRFERYHYLSFGATVLMCTVIVVAMTRFGNREG